MSKYKKTKISILVASVALIGGYTGAMFAKSKMQTEVLKKELSKIDYVNYSSIESHTDWLFNTTTKVYDLEANKGKLSTTVANISDISESDGNVHHFKITLNGLKTPQTKMLDKEIDDIITDYDKQLEDSDNTYSNGSMMLAEFIKQVYDNKQVSNNVTFTYDDNEGISFLYNLTNNSGSDINVAIDVNPEVSKELYQQMRQESNFSVTAFDSSLIRGLDEVSVDGDFNEINFYKIFLLDKSDENLVNEKVIKDYIADYKKDITIENPNLDVVMNALQQNLLAVNDEDKTLIKSLDKPANMKFSFIAKYDRLTNMVDIQTNASIEDTDSDILDLDAQFSDVSLSLANTDNIKYDVSLDVDGPLLTETQRVLFELIPSDIVKKSLEKKLGLELDEDDFYLYYDTALKMLYLDDLHFVAKGAGVSDNDLFSLELGYKDDYINLFNEDGMVSFSLKFSKTRLQDVLEMLLAQQVYYSNGHDEFENILINLLAVVNEDIDSISYDIEADNDEIMQKIIIDGKTIDPLDSSITINKNEEILTGYTTVNIGADQLKTLSEGIVSPEEYIKDYSWPTTKIDIIFSANNDIDMSLSIFDDSENKISQNVLLNMNVIKTIKQLFNQEDSQQIKVVYKNLRTDDNWKYTLDLDKIFNGEIKGLPAETIIHFKDRTAFDINGSKDISTTASINATNLFKTNLSQEAETLDDNGVVLSYNLDPNDMDDFVSSSSRTTELKLSMENKGLVSVLNQNLSNESMQMGLTFVMPTTIPDNVKELVKLKLGEDINSEPQQTILQSLKQKIEQLMFGKQQTEELVISNIFSEDIVNSILNLYFESQDIHGSLADELAINEKLQSQREQEQSLETELNNISANVDNLKVSLSNNNGNAAENIAILKKSLANFETDKNAKTSKLAKLRQEIDNSEKVKQDLKEEQKEVVNKYIQTLSKSGLEHIEVE